MFVVLNIVTIFVVYKKQIQMENLTQSEKMTTAMINSINESRAIKSNQIFNSHCSDELIQSMQDKSLTFEQMIEVIETAKNRVNLLIELRDRSEVNPYEGVVAETFTFDGDE